MYLHLGSEKSTKFTDIIGIFDLDTSTVMRPTNDFLTKMQKENRVIEVNENLPKSFVLEGRPVHSMRKGRLRAREDRRNTRVVISPLASSTLKKRSSDVKQYLLSE